MNDREIFYDRGGSGSGTAGVKVESLSNSEGTERRKAEAGLSDGGRTWEYEAMIKQGAKLDMIFGSFLRYMKLTRNSVLKKARGSLKVM